MLRFNAMSQVITKLNTAVPGDPVVKYADVSTLAAKILVFFIYFTTHFESNNLITQENNDSYLLSTLQWMLSHGKSTSLSLKVSKYFSYCLGRTNSGRTYRCLKFHGRSCFFSHFRIISISVSLSVSLTISNLLSLLSPYSLYLPAVISHLYSTLLSLYLFFSSIPLYLHISNYFYLSFPFSL